MTAPTDLRSLPKSEQLNGYRWNTDGTVSLDTSFTREEIASIERLVLRTVAFLHTHLRDHPLDAAACLLVVSARMADALKPNVTLKDLETWARERWRPIRGIANLRGFGIARSKVQIPAEPDDELRELTWLLWCLVRETCREPGAMGLCGMIGPLLQMAASLCRQSLAMNGNEFEFAVGLAWMRQEAWMPSASIPAVTAEGEAA